MRSFRSGSALLLAALLPAVQACSTGDAAAADPEFARAAATFAAFQDALFEKDATALRSLLCRDARPAISALLERSLEDQPRLAVLGIERRGFEFHLRVGTATAVTEASTGDDAPSYVLAIEEGEMRVDLLASVRENSVTVQRRLAAPTFVPRELSLQEQIQASRRRR